MNVGSTKEKNPEKRISITPDTSKSLKGLGLNIFLEKGYGESLGYKDQEYKDKGVQILNDPKEVLSKSNLICQVKLPIEVPHEYTSSEELPLSHETVGSLF